MPSLINKYNVLINKKTNSPEKPIKTESSNAKTNIFKKFLNKNLKKTQIKKNTDLHSSAKFNKNEAQNQKLQEDAKNSNLKMDKPNTIMENMTGSDKKFNLHEGDNKKFHSEKYGNKTSNFGRNQQLSTDGKPRKMSLLDLKVSEDYQIPNEEVLKTQPKMPFKSKRCFIFFIFFIFNNFL